MFYGFLPKARWKELKMSLFLYLFLLGTLFVSSGSTKNLGYCPKDPAKACQASLSTALNILTNCALDRPRIKECAMIFIETLSEADDKAPFYEEFYEKNFEVGNVEAYKKEIESLKQYSQRAWLVLHNLSKALILNYIDVSKLTAEQKREIENLIQPVFEISENRKFDINDAVHRKLFIEKELSRAQAIEWGSPDKKIILS